MPQRILLVDDEEDMRHMLIDRLEFFLPGCFIQEAGDGMAAIHAVDKSIGSSDPLDIIICDYQLPGFDGVETLEMCRQHGYRGLSVLFTGVKSDRAPTISDVHVIAEKNINRLIEYLKENLG